MKCVFVDETSDSKFKDYFGLCCAVIDYTKYRRIKSDFQKILREGGWDTSIEFKGSFLYSNIVAYLAARIDIISNGFELFEDLTLELVRKSGKIKKLKSSINLINNIKNIDWYTLETE